jgi:hypothetical protein
MSTPFDDAFTGNNGDPINTALWAITGSPDIQSNTAELTPPETITSLFTFDGDFNVQIDFAIQSEPATNSFGCDFWAYADATHYIGIRAARFSNAKYFQRFSANGGAEAYAQAARTNSTGSLKIIRTGDTYQVWRKDGAGAWTQLSTNLTLACSSPTSIIIRIVYWDLNPVVTCRWDNYLINVGYYLQTGLNVSKAVLYALVKKDTIAPYDMSVLTGMDQSKVYFNPQPADMSILTGMVEPVLSINIPPADMEILTGMTASEIVIGGEVPVNYRMFLVW